MPDHRCAVNVGPLWLSGDYHPLFPSGPVAPGQLGYNLPRRAR